MIRAAVLGSPIGHSLSPILHSRAYQYLGIAGRYEAIEVKPGELSTFLEGLDDSPGERWTGFSLTMPLKEEVMNVASEVEPLAQSIASANTLTRCATGWRVSTTDVNGFRAALKAHGVADISSVAIFGAGATARAAAHAIDAAHRDIYVIHRSPQREAAMRRAAPTSRLHFLPWGSLPPPVDLTINTTPRGAIDHLVHDPALNFAGVLFEALYDPWPTPILAAWRQRDLVVIDGLDLLVHQGIDQLALMSHRAIDRQDLAPILRAACIAELLQGTTR